MGNAAEALDFLTDEEKAIVDEMGDDPDEHEPDPPENPPVAAEAPAPAAPAAPAAEAAAPAAPVAAVAAPVAPPPAPEAIAPDPAPRFMDATPPEGYDEKVAAIEAAKEALDQQVEDGSLTMSAWRKAIDEQNRELFNLNTQKAQSEFAERNNTQALEAAWDNSLGAYIKQYPQLGAPTMRAAWNAKLQPLLKEPGHETKPMSWFLQESHRRMHAELYGHIPAGASADPRARPPAPPSLAGTPAAGAPDPGVEEFSAIDRAVAAGGVESEMEVARFRARDPVGYARWLETT